MRKLIFKVEVEGVNGRKNKCVNFGYNVISLGFAGGAVAPLLRSYP